MKLTYYGHGCLGLETMGMHLLVDPFITPNALAKDIDIHTIAADYLLLTHAHGDHVADVEAIASRTKAPIISNYEIVTYYEGKGLAGGHPLNHGGKFSFPFGTLKYVSAVHSSVFPDGSHGGNPGGFVLWNEEGCCYIAGDTALTMDMKLIPLTCPALTFAVLPVGDNFTMGPEDAALASDFIGCKTIVGCHFDTFGYIEIDHEQARAAFAKHGATLLLPRIGQTIEF